MVRIPFEVVFLMRVVAMRKIPGFVRWIVVRWGVAMGALVFGLVSSEPLAAGGGGGTGPVITIRTRLVEDRGPTRFPSTEMWNYEDPMLWKGLSLPREKPVKWPLGFGSVVVWEGGTKVFLDLENDGQQRIRLPAASGRDDRVAIRIHYPRRVARYAVLTRSLGQEDYLGLSIRYVKSQRYPIRYARACHREGRLDGKRLILVDDTLNGNYDDFGKDAVLVGDRSIQPLTRVLDCGAVVYRVERVTPDGTEVRLVRYTDDLGRLQAEWSPAHGRDRKPQLLVFRCLRGPFVNTFVNLADGQARRVPPGVYAFVRGILTTGQDRDRRFVRIGPGRAEPVVVRPDQTTMVRLGAPFDVRAGIEMRDDELLVPGWRMNILGRAGEEYRDFYPDSFEANVSVRIGRRTFVRNEDVGQSTKNEADRYGRSVVWYPRPVTFEGPRGAEYEVRVDVESRLLGSIEGAWHATRPVDRNTE